MAKQAKNIKTSEFIRERLLNWNPSIFCDVDDSNPDIDLRRARFLCALFDGNQKATDELMSWMKTNGRRGIIVSASDLAHLGIDCMTAREYAKHATCLRYMIADFMACYFESIGD